MRWVKVCVILAESRDSRPIMKFDLRSLLRPNIAEIVPYSSARDEYTGKEGVFLDANENPIASVADGPYNRYPDPLQRTVKEKIAKIKGIDAEHIFLGNGSDEPIDLLFRAFCEPKEDNVITLPPTYGMYRVCADINNVKVIEVPLTAETYDIKTGEILQQVGPNTKIIWVCSPNNPTGNLATRSNIYELLDNFNGLVVIDEAYIDFASEPSFIYELDKYPNLVVLQTFSKAWGMAALRLGMAYASKEIIEILNKIKYPYNINLATQEIALKALEKEAQKDEMVKEIMQQRNWLEAALSELSMVQKIYPSDANFLLVKVKAARKVYEQLIGKLVIVRDRSKVTLCDECLRITVGTADENVRLIQELKEL